MQHFGQLEIEPIKNVSGGSKFVVPASNKNKAVGFDESVYIDNLDFHFGIMDPDPAENNTSKILLPPGLSSCCLVVQPKLRQQVAEAVAGHRCVEDRRVVVGPELLDVNQVGTYNLKTIIFIKKTCKGVHLEKLKKSFSLNLFRHIC